jgi:hypothetical protein
MPAWVAFLLGAGALYGVQKFTGNLIPTVRTARK